MPHHTPLIATIVAGLSVAFVLGALANRLRIPPLVGYLLAGVLVGPFTPGYVADQELANELAEIGVILLMFGVGLHFSLKDLLSVRKIAVPGAIGQMAVATALGVGLSHLLGWSLVSGLVLGLALSVASTVVLLRALQERRVLQTDRGRIAVGWLIVEDLAMVLALVLLPALADAIARSQSGGPVDASAWVLPLALTLAKVSAFVAFMLIVGRRVIPWVMHYVAHTGSRELFRLAVLVIALGVAFGAAALFDVSFALGAFFAGMILSESELSHRAAEETLPLRDAFSVLFFVSVGMLFNPQVVIESPWALLGVLAVILVGKSLAAFAIVSAFGHNRETAATVSVSLAQIGEFSFILGGLGVGLGLLPEEGQALILAGAIFSIVLNPLLFHLFTGAPRPKAGAKVEAPASDLSPTRLSDHTILVGYGRVGAAAAERLDAREEPFLVIEYGGEAERRAKAAGHEVLVGNAAEGRVLAAAGVERARCIISTIPDGFEAGQVTEQAKRSNPSIQAVARAHSDAEVEHLIAHRADNAVIGEHELAEALLNRVFGPARPRIETAPPPAAPLPPPPPGRLILDDAERALLSGVKQRSIGPGQAVSLETLEGDARLLGDYGSERLQAAAATLIEKGCLTRLDDGRVSPSLAGVMAAASAPDY